MSNTEFLPHDPVKALKAVKDVLYGRLEILRTCLGPGYRQIGFEPDEVERQMLNEIDFLEDVLDKIERS